MIKISNDKKCFLLYPENGWMDLDIILYMH